MVHAELPNSFLDVVTDKLRVLPCGSLLQLLQELLLLCWVLGRLATGVPLEDLVKGDLSWLVEPIAKFWLLCTT